MCFTYQLIQNLLGGLSKNAAFFYKLLVELADSLFLASAYRLQDVVANVLKPPRTELSECDLKRRNDVNERFKIILIHCVRNLEHAMRHCLFSEPM